MNETNPTRPPKPKKVATWLMPASIILFLGIVFSFFFLPFGILLFIVGMVFVGYHALRNDVPEELETETDANSPN